MTTWTTTVPSPVGDLVLTSDGEALTRVLFPARPDGSLDGSWRSDRGPFVAVIDQLEAYFMQDRTTFDIPLRPSGSTFQLAVWSALRTIPYGQTRTYGQIATVVQQPSAVRAVGAANARNPLAIVVPCHRVIGADGSLTGFAGGLATKRHLLELEGALGARQEALL